MDDRLIEPLALLHGRAAAQAVAGRQARWLAGGPHAYALARLLGVRVRGGSCLPAPFPPHGRRLPCGSACPRPMRACHRGHRSWGSST
ncbi:hypothetical protein RAA17_23670 [Komagataeibacter rhaeticus]|nr:hypothetical protein [Komagataeibacter rhaeticus]